MSFMYLYVFLQSNLLEVPFYHLGLRRRQDWGRSLALVTLVNSLTQPIVFFGIMNLRLSYLENILVAEAFAIIAETVAFRLLIGRRWRASLIAAFVANLISWQLAPILTYLLFG